MTPQELANINTVTRHMIENYMEKHNLNLNQFSKKAQCHQSQLHLYVYGDRFGEKKGLHSSTLEKIGQLLMKDG